MSNRIRILSGLPGAEIIREGLIDQRAGRRTIASCLVEMAAPRLAKAGLLESPPALPGRPEEESELHLYRLLQHLGNRAFSQYNSHLRLLTSFERALDQRLSQSGQSRPFSS